MLCERNYLFYRTDSTCSGVLLFLFVFLFSRFFGHTIDLESLFHIMRLIRDCILYNLIPAYKNVGHFNIFIKNNEIGILYIEQFGVIRKSPAPRIDIL